jgi:membrane fusion protein, multidrug efflux system
MKHRLFFVSFSAALLLSACGGEQAGAGPGGGGRNGGMGGGPPAVVTTQLVQSTVWREGIEAMGTARARESIVIASQLSERVAEVRFDSGQQARAGQILVVMETASERADVSQSTTALRDAERQLKRGEELARQKLVSQSQLDTLRANRDAARARLQSSSAGINDRVIAAPFSGVLGLRQVSKGQYVSPGTEITTLDDISQIEVEFELPERFLSRMQTGLPLIARSEAWPDQEFAGKLSAVDARVNPATRSIAARALIENPEGKLRPGMLLRVLLEENARNVVAVPEIAVQQIGERSFVYLLDEENKAIRRDIKVGSRQAGQAEILNGLKGGERMVVDGAVKLREGQQARDANDPAPESKGRGDGKPGQRGQRAQ